MFRNPLLMTALAMTLLVAGWGFVDTIGLSSLAAGIVEIVFRSRGWFIMLTASTMLLVSIWLARNWSSWREALVIAKPDTVVRWHRKGFRLFWKFKSNTPQGGISASKVSLRSLSGGHFKFLILMYSLDFLFFMKVNLE